VKKYGDEKRRTSSKTTTKGKGNGYVDVFEKPSYTNKKPKPKNKKQKLITIVLKC
jgi:hypothetical protein